MYYGGIGSILSSDKDRIAEIAEKLGKLHENDKLKIYYRKKGEYIRSILAPSDYPEKILDTAEALSLSSLSIVYLPENLSWVDGEILMLIDSLNISKKIIVSSLDGKKIENLVNSLKNFTNFELNNNLNEIEEFKEDDKGIVYVDRVFTVKGVGTVVTGFSFTTVEVHEKLISLPYNKEVEVKSIQVLDEDQKNIGSGVRIGFSIKNVKEEEIKDMTYLVKPDVKIKNEIEGNITKYKWSSINQGQNHIVVKGHAIAVNLISEGERVKIKSSSPIPLVDSQIPVLNVNVKQGKPRVVGYINL
ncbi:MAG: translation elongation factor [Saccharolobus sp.]